MLTAEHVLITLAVMWIAAMIVWDWSGKPNGVVLPAKDDEDDWHDWPPSGMR